MKNLIILCVMLALLGSGCGSASRDDRVHVRRGVASDSLGNNIITRPIRDAFEAITGAGIVVDKAIMNRNNNSGFPQIIVFGRNKSSKTKRFRYKVEWLDADGVIIDTRGSVWKQWSVTGKSPFQIKEAATTAEAVNFRMDTRKWE